VKPRNACRRSRSGRNQHLALAAAEILPGQAGIRLLAAGTDGSTEDAGALVDGATGQRALTDGLDLETALDQAGVGSLLESTGDLITTGPTDTCVMDLVIGLKLWDA
jgi:hydroxypyruvate reductase